MTTDATAVEALIANIGKAILGESTESLAMVLSKSAAMILNLLAERDALKADAERYRYLRNPDPAIRRELDVCDDFMVVQEGRHLDEAIDAALAASEPKNTGE